MRLWLPGRPLSKRWNVAAGDLVIRHRGSIPYIFSIFDFVCTGKSFNVRVKWGLLNPLLTGHFPFTVQRMSDLRGEQFSPQKRKRALRKNWEVGR